MTDFFARNEFVALIVAAIVTALAPFATSLGLALPETSIAAVVGLSWALFVATVIEGRVKPDYAAGIKVLFTSTKFRATLVTLVAVVASEFARGTFGIELPEGALVDVVNFVVLLVLALAGVDVAKVLMDKPAPGASE